MARDPLENYLFRSLSTKELNCEKIASSPELVKTILSLEESEEVVIVEEGQMNLDGLMLKELSKHLGHAFLGYNGTKPVIVFAALNVEMEKSFWMFSRKMWELDANLVAYCFDAKE